MKKRKKKLNNLEKDFESILKTLEFKYKKQYPYKNKIYDFLLTEYNILIEVDGDFYHCNEAVGFKPKYAIQKRNIKNDKYKDWLIKKSNKFELIRFWENDIKNNLEKVVKDLLLIKESFNDYKKIRNTKKNR